MIFIIQLQMPYHAGWVLEPILRSASLYAP